MTSESKQIDCSDKGIIEMLYAETGKAALSKTLYIVKSRSVAEEILQDVFVKLWSKKLIFDNVRAAYAWIYKASTNASIDHLRLKSSQSVKMDFEVEDESLDEERKLSIKQAWSGLLNILSDQESELFIYKYAEGLSQDEIAEVMKTSRRTVNRLQTKLNAKLDKYRESNKDSHKDLMKGAANE